MAVFQASLNDSDGVRAARSQAPTMNRSNSTSEPEREYDGGSSSPATQVNVHPVESNVPRTTPKAGEQPAESYGEGSSGVVHQDLLSGGFNSDHTVRRPVSEEGSKRRVSGSGVSSRPSGHHIQDSNSSKTMEEASLSQPTSLKPQFYLIRNEIDRGGNFLDDNAMRHGAFRSRVDPRHILRIAYSLGGQNLEAIHPEKMPDGINIWVIRINSEPITMFLKSILDVEVGTDSILEISAPFRILIHNFEIIREQQVLLEEKYSKEAVFQAPELGYETHLALVHFRLLVQFMDEHLGKSIRLYRRIQLGECSRISFPDLWMLYDSGSIIYSDDSLVKLRRRRDPGVDFFHSYHRMHRVLAVVGGIPLQRGLVQLANRASSRPWDSNLRDRHFIEDVYSDIRVFCYTIDYDTKSWGACPVIFSFAPFDGEKEISSLSAYPVPNSHPLRAQLKERGEKFIKMTTISHWEHDGMTMGTGHGLNIFHASGQVVVDLKSAVRRGVLGFLNLEFEFDTFKRNWMPPKENEVVEIFRPGHTYIQVNRFGGEYRVPVDVYREIQMKQFHQAARRVYKLLHHLEEAQGSGDLGGLTDLMHEEEDILLLPGTITGYTLRHRIWAKLDIDILKPVSETPRWDDLILPRGHKEMVQALVETHFRESPSLSTSSKKRQPGLTGGKGKGSVILLHGPPGVGKTSTAECAASSAKRPFLQVSCGDLGYQPVQVEGNLEELFDLAPRWGCILVVEEADVFLARRNNENLQRNALTSIFLRVLEHYQGILFLTTNRIDAIDDAFRSRLHSILYYPPLSKDKSLKVWELNLRRVKEQNEARIQDGRSEILMKNEEILEFAAESQETMKWNGRQIRNAFHTALAIAEFKVRDEGRLELVVGKDEFQTVANSLAEFDSCLTASCPDESHLA